MISSGSNPAGEIREAAPGSPEVWPCTTAKLKGTKKDKIHSTHQALALMCPSMLLGPVASADRSDQQPPDKSQPLWDTEFLELWNSIKENIQCLDGQDWTGIFFKCECPSGKWCSALRAEPRTQNSLLQESSCLNQMSTVWGHVIIHPKHPYQLPTPGCLPESFTQTWQILRSSQSFFTGITTNLGIEGTSWANISYDKINKILVYKRNGLST